MENATQQSLALRPEQVNKVATKTKNSQWRKPKLRKKQQVLYFLP